MKLAIQVDKTIYIDYPTKDAPEDFKDFMKGFMEFLADKVIKRIDEVIRRQLYSWEPLSKSYLNWKKRMGLDPKIWIASGQTKNAISYWYYPMADAYFIGVHPRTLHRGYKKGGIDTGVKTKARLLKIIEWLEFGTRKMKPRPLFTKVLREFQSKTVQKKLYQEYITKVKTGA